MNTNISKLIRERITAKDKTTLFVPDDFNFIGNDALVLRTLSRLVCEGLLKRVTKGIYIYYLRDRTLTLNDITLFIAKKYHVRAIPCGLTALYLLGVIDDEPSDAEYLTDGGARFFPMQDKTITFRRAAKKIFACRNQRFAMIVAAMKQLGDENLKPDIVSRLRKIIAAEKEEMAGDFDNAPLWIRKRLGINNLEMNSMTVSPPRRRFSQNELLAILNRVYRDDNIPWLVIYMPGFNQRDVARALDEHHLSYYVPVELTVVENHEKKSRRKIPKAVVNNMLFVKQTINPYDIAMIVKDMPFTAWMLYKSDHRTPQQIKSAEMYEFQVAANPNISKVNFYNSESKAPIPKHGAAVRVKTGILKGFVGHIASIKSKTFLVKELFGTYAMIQINRCDCEIIDDKEKE